MPSENYTAFAFARAFLISRWFVVCGLLFIVYCLWFGRSTVQRFNGLMVDRHFVIRIIPIGYL